MKYDIQELRSSVGLRDKDSQKWVNLVLFTLLLSHIEDDESEYYESN